MADTDEIPNSEGAAGELTSSARAIWAAKAEGGGSGVPAGWSVYERKSVADNPWVGEHTGPAGIDFRLSAPSREVLLERIEAWAAYRRANGVAA